MVTSFAERQAKQTTTGRALAEARRCPRCRRKMALTYQRDEAGMMHRTCRWPDCRHTDVLDDRPARLEAVALAAGTLVDELATQRRTSIATYDTLKRAVAALRGTQER